MWCAAKHSPRRLAWVAFNQFAEQKGFGPMVKRFHPGVLDDILHHNNEVIFLNRNQRVAVATFIPGDTPDNDAVQIEIVDLFGVIRLEAADRFREIEPEIDPNFINSMSGKIYVADLGDINRIPVPAKPVAQCRWLRPKVIRALH